MHRPLASFRLRTLAGLAALVAAWGLLGAAVAQPRPDVTLWIPGDSVTTGVPFDLTIESSTPAHRGIDFPSATADSVFGDLEIVRRSDVHTRRVGAGYAIDSVSYTLRTSARDSIRIPAIPIRIDVAVGTLTTHTVPRTVRVRAARSSSVLAPLGRPSSNPLGWFVLAVVVGGLLYGGIFLWRRRREADVSLEEPTAGLASPPDASTEPYETACRTLSALASRDLSDPAVVEAVHVTLAEVVRAYLSRRWDVAAEGRTTADLLAALDHRADVPPDAVESLRAVLEQADRVKYAGVRPAPPAVEETFQTARTALDRLHAASSPSSPPDAPSK